LLRIAWNRLAVIEHDSIRASTFAAYFGSVRGIIGDRDIAFFVVRLGFILAQAISRRVPGSSSLRCSLSIAHSSYLDPIMRLRASSVPRCIEKAEGTVGRLIVACSRFVRIEQGRRNKS